jgi:hypothetical protein
MTTGANYRPTIQSIQKAFLVSDLVKQTLVTLPKQSPIQSTGGDLQGLAKIF